MYAESVAAPARQPAVPARLPVAAALLWIGALLVSAAPWFGELDSGALLSAFWTVNAGDYASILAHYSWAPRVSIAILVGCGLGLAGAVTQQILGNPLASPTTLGVEAGGQFGMTVATVFFPGLLAFSPDLAAIAGGLLAIGLVITLTWRLGFSPVTVILAGLVITFFLGAVNMAFLLLKGEWLGNLFVWGAGSLVQNNWDPFMELWPRVLVLATLMLLLMHPLQVLQLGQTSANSLGAKVGLIRLLALLLVVLMTATVVSRVGVVAFVGLAAPVMASGGTVASQLLNWMYGSTWLVSESEALGLLALILLISTTLLLVVRPLTILPLGETSAMALGLPVAKMRLALLLLAALLTASATVVIGPLSFVGLIAPHLARVLGQQTVGRQLLVAALAGGLLLGVADYLSRIVVYPDQLPAGLLAALVGGVYFLWGLSRHGRA